MTAPKQLHFRTNVLLKSIIGKDLITDDYIAVLELVKNSFDAQSKKVELSFENITVDGSDSSKILIQDYGSGMSLTDIEKKWLNIAYSEKKSQKQFGGRVFAGNKGVGRFSCDRLGKFLDIYTKTQDSEKILHLIINWELFEVDDEIDFQIQDIGINYNYLSRTEFSKTTGYGSFTQGTLLVISQLRDVWDRNKILRLKKNLEKLLNPNQVFNSEAFEIWISVPELKAEDKGKAEFERVNGIVENKVFKQLDFKATSIITELDEAGKFLKTTLQDRGREIFELTEHNPFPLLKNIKIVVYYLNPYSKAYFKRQSGIRSVDFGSIFLFINGFRIPPYGDDGDDWLGIELRKGQGYSRFLGTREILGRIEIVDEHGEFQIISNRAGVVNSEKFGQLTSMEAPHGLFYKTFRRIERFVTEGIKWDSVPKEIEKKIEKAIEGNKKWTEEKETFREDQLIRDQRVLSSIIKILNVDAEELVNLQINEVFVRELVKAQKDAAEHEIEAALGKLQNEGLTAEHVKSILQQLEEKNHQIEAFSNSLSKYSNHLKESETQEEIKKISSVSSSLDVSKKDFEALHQRLKEAEEANKKLQEQIEIERDKNTYLKASSKNLSDDAKGLIHNIKITAKDIRSNVNTLIDKITSNEIKEKEILRRLGLIKFSSEKALKISKLITRSNFKTQANTQIVDIAKYIEQYISIYSDMYEYNKLKFTVNNQDASLEKRISVLDLSLVLDDLISNSEKAKASQVLIEMSDSLEILFSDNGKGLESKFLDKPNEIFELGVTTTDGSGIGLNSVRKTLSSMNGKIEFVGNNYKLEGATFRITFD